MKKDIIAMGKPVKKFSWVHAINLRARKSRFRIIVLLCFFLMVLLVIHAQKQWHANWIIDPNSDNATNSWFCFRNDFTITDVPVKAIAKIAADSKYWLWINGKPVIFEGGLKRGPNPTDTYYDEVRIAGFLEKGHNSISVLTCYFGKGGFSHNSSGKADLLFECIVPGSEIVSNSSWKVKQHPAFETCAFPVPNFRLPESSIQFYARRDIGFWQDMNFDASSWQNARELGIPPVSPWNNLILGPIPQWKNSGLLPYTSRLKFPSESTGDTILCVLPDNLQITPFLKVDATEDQLIEIRTDNFYGGSEPNIRAEYITRKGIQEYESYGWMNGNKVRYLIPKGVILLDLKFRETGFDTEFAGNFTSSDDFLNRIWEKSKRTLYVTMRDNYMDCPDRECAQWWGDEVNEGGEAFYALCTKSHLLFRKGMYELIGWQREDSTLFLPVPSANWNNELPCQMLSSIGYYGFWNYYINTAD